MGAVLIVDDNAADRALFCTILSRGGHTVYEVAKGSEAVAKAREVRPNIIVLDVNLPDLNGLEVCRALRAEREVATTPVLMLTVRHDDSDVLEGLKAGADDYVAKDSAPELVLTRVERLLQFRHMASVAVLNQQLVQVGRLLAGIVHEIRGPLSVIRGSAELLRQSKSVGADDIQWIDSILRSTQLLQVRLEHLMAAVRSGPPVLKEVELGPLIREAVELFVKGLPLHNRRMSVETDFDEPIPIVQVDSGRFIQVLLDLLNNAHQAIASTQSEGRVLIRMTAEEENGRSWVKIAVSDDGPGIPESYLGRVFDPFFTTKEGGSGYGLYLASSIIQEQGGRLTGQNNQSGGACFTIWLPSK